MRVLICHLDTSLVVCGKWSQVNGHTYFSIATTHAMPPPRKQMHDLSNTTPWPARHRKVQKQPALLLQANQPTKAISYPREEKLVRYGIPRPSCGQPHPCELHLVDRRPGDTVTTQRMISSHRCGPQLRTGPGRNCAEPHLGDVLNGRRRAESEGDGE